MNNPWRQPVNAHLRKASALVELADEQSENLSRLAVEALLEGSMLQLGFALRAYFNELAENYQSPAAGAITNLKELEQALLALDKQPAELNELLIAESEGWLGDLQAARGRIGRLDNSAAASGSNMIQTRQSQASQLDEEGLERWLTRVKELVERHREMMVEC